MKNLQLAKNIKIEILRLLAQQEEKLFKKMGALEFFDSILNTVAGFMDWYTAQCNVTGHHETFVEYPLIPEVMFLSSFSITYPTISYKQNFKGVRLGVNTG